MLQSLYYIALFHHSLVYFAVVSLLIISFWVTEETGINKPLNHYEYDWEQ